MQSDDPYFVRIKESSASPPVLSEQEAKYIISVMDQELNGYQERLISMSPNVGPKEREQIRDNIYGAYNSLLETLRFHVQGDARGGEASRKMYKKHINEFVASLPQRQQQQKPVRDLFKEFSPISKTDIAVAGVKIETDAKPMTKEQAQELARFAGETVRNVFSRIPVSNAFTKTMKNSLVGQVEAMLDAFRKIPGMTTVFPVMFWFIISAGLYYGKDAMAAEEWSRGLSDFLKQETVTQLLSPEVANFVNTGLKDLEKLLFEIQTSKHESYAEGVTSWFTLGFSGIVFSAARMMKYFSQYFINLAVNLSIQGVSEATFSSLYNAILIVIKGIVVHLKAQLPKEAGALVDAFDRLVNYAFVALNVATNAGYVMFGSIALFAFAILLRQIPYIGALSEKAIVYGVPILLAYVKAHKSFFSNTPALQEKADTYDYGEEDDDDDYSEEEEEEEDEPLPPRPVKITRGMQAKRRSSSRRRK